MQNNSYSITCRLKLMLACTFFLLAITYCNAQEQGKVSGTVLDENNHPLSLATVTILSSKDSSLVTAGTTDSLGKYSLNIPDAGSYLAKFSMTGYENRFLPFYFPGNISVTQPVQVLKPAPQNLSAVSVTSRKKLVENQEGKTVYNVESSINSTGSTALEILQKTSGLQVDNADNFSLRGRSGVRIYVNGREMPLDNKSMIAYLRSINSNDIKSIEVITNPDASYDAAGSAGIINIRLKKNQQYGANGDISVGYIQGITPKGNAALSLNYRNKKLNAFGSLNGDLGQYATQFNLYRIQLDTLYDQRTLMHNYNNGFNIKAGLDYSINDKNIIGVMATYGYSDALFSSAANTPIYSGSGSKFEHKIRSVNQAPGNIINDNFNLNYRYADTSGNEINFDANYGFFKHTSDAYLPNYYYDGSGNFLYSIVNRNHAPTSIDIYTAKIDLAHNLWKGKLNYGAKVSSVRTNNTYYFFDQNLNGPPVKNPDLSSRFTYDEDIKAAFINYRRSVNKKWTVITGLRVEQTNSKGQLFKGDSIEHSSVTERNYTGLFPTAAVVWDASQKHSFSLSYNRRIDRPVYQDLNPFELKLDEFTYFRGNEFLQPQYTNQVTLSDRFYDKFNAGIFYSSTKDYSLQGSDTAKNEIYAQVRNVGTQKMIGLDVSASVKITSWWSSYQEFWGKFQLFDVTIDRIKLKKNIPIFGVNTQHSFSLGNGYSAELNGWFNGPGTVGIIWKVKSMAQIDIGAKKMLFNNSLAIKLSVTDIFHTNKLYPHGSFSGVLGIGSLIPETQTVRLNISWRFGSSQIKAARQRQTGSENESDRIKKQ